MLLLSYLYDLSERQVEEFCNYFLPAKYFIGLAIDGQAPDHSTLTLFKKRILENGKLRAYERMLEQIVTIAQEAGIVFGPLQLVDSTHSIADVDLAQEKHRDDDDRGPRDPGARWGCKGVYTFHDGEGEPHRRRKYFYGLYLDGVELSSQVAHRPTGHRVNLNHGYGQRACFVDKIPGVPRLDRDRTVSEASRRTR